jgi:cell division protein FtsI (penicillin-binding protein 3)
MPDVRLTLVGVVLVMAWVGIGVRLVDVQALSAEQYAARGIDQRVRRETLPAMRGTIFDRDHVQLATSVDALTVIADPEMIDDDAATAELLAPIVGQSAAALEEMFSQDDRYAEVAGGFEGPDADGIRAFVQANDLEGIFLRSQPKRVYPAGSLAAQVIGFVGTEGFGLAGLEYQYEEALAGTPGLQIVERDPFGNTIPQGEYVVDPAEHGADLVLTIDKDIQFATENALEESMLANGAQAGSVIVLEAATGDILAMANVPGFDPNDLRGVGDEMIRNRAVSDVYEPGSTLKVVTVAAALEEGLVEASTRIEVPAEYVIELEADDKVYTDVGRRRTEELSVAEIVARSSNIGTILIQGMLGNDTHHRYLAAFGLGRQAARQFPGEAAGSLEDARNWCETTCGPSTAIGYRVAVTPLQMAGVFAAIANDGVWVEPHIVNEVIHPDLSREAYQPRTRPVLSEQTALTMQRLLQGVVEGPRGTGRRAAVAGYTVGGKTGTTEKYLPEEGVYSEEDRIASFIGIAPASDPRIVVAVVLDSPSGEDEAGNDLHFGGVSAAPVFAAVAEAALHSLGVPPDAP